MIFLNGHDPLSENKVDVSSFEWVAQVSLLRPGLPTQLVVRGG
jgi:hypothetical protein